MELRIMEDGGSRLRGLWDRVRRAPAATASWARRCWVWIKSHPSWLARTWPVSVPVVAAGVLLWLLPGWDLKLRYSGLTLESVGLFIIARRLYLIREQFAAPTAKSLITSWWGDRPRMGRRHVLVVLDGVSMLSAVSAGRGLVLPGAPPPEDASVEAQIRALRNAVVALSDTIGSIHGEIHKRIDEVDAEGKRRITEIDTRLAAETTSLRDVIRDSTAGNVQREQWAVVLLFVGAVLMVASAHA